ncbi:MAG: AAA family ATPase, partial [Desulfovibrio sp.]|nr:AAA family ATPase [Desulfovibrio sp.]
TEAVRKAPYSVLLLDELEKAHPDIFNILLQVMDYGTLTDNTGRKTDFSNVILIMTSNAGAFEMSKRSLGFKQGAYEDSAKKALQAVEQLFAPEFRNRLDAMVPFHNLSEDLMLNIVDKFLSELEKTLSERKVKLALTEEARRWLAKKGYDPSMGARPLRRLIREKVEDALATELLFGFLKKGGTALFEVEGEELVLRKGEEELPGDIEDNPPKEAEPQKEEKEVKKVRRKRTSKSSKAKEMNDSQETKE